ncbi:hypothetical protein [Streptomyces sp. NPDC046909]|uniref:hypothetical protein n=1 Tax=Streptomyces sp. NPDC046909 TaxID=3155617 RepID=UPI00340BF52F
MATTRIAIRRVVLGGIVLALGMLTPATGGRADAAAATTTTAAAGVTSRSGSPTSTVDRVADFYGTYIDVLYDTGRGRLANALRAHYLTTDLQRSLARWETVHHRDGVLRAEGVPVRWSVVYNDSGMGHCWSRVTLTWQDPGNRTHHTHLMVQSDLATMLISGIRTDK